MRFSLVIIVNLHYVQVYRPNKVPDKKAKLCQICKMTFSLLKRRHHCRHCGRVVCDECSTGRRPVFDQGLELVRVDRQCYRVLGKKSKPLPPPAADLSVDDEENELKERVAAFPLSECKGVFVKPSKFFWAIAIKREKKTEEDEENIRVLLVDIDHFVEIGGTTTMLILNWFQQMFNVGRDNQRVVNFAQINALAHCLAIVDVDHVSVASTRPAPQQMLQERRRHTAFNLNTSCFLMRYKQKTCKITS